MVALRSGVSALTVPLSSLTTAARTSRSCATSDGEATKTRILGVFTDESISDESISIDSFPATFYTAGSEEENFVTRSSGRGNRRDSGSTGDRTAWRRKAPSVKATRDRLLLDLFQRLDSAAERERWVGDLVGFLDTANGREFTRQLARAVLGVVGEMADLFERGAELVKKNTEDLQASAVTGALRSDELAKAEVMKHAGEPIPKADFYWKLAQENLSLIGFTPLAGSPKVPISLPGPSLVRRRKR